ncbi:hypothetical protein LBMAG27_22130 [Bacteroidota bacterium]|nr:hypothetical protein LBMAG27_22130 [Bacteroidota bacterium]
MKKLIFILIAVSASSISFAQKSQVVSAWNYLNNGELDKAKTAINTATNDETTKIMAKTWFYRGNIYLAIYNDSTRKKDFNDLTEAYNSYIKAKEYDAKGDFTIDLMNPWLEVAYYTFNEAVIPYNAKDYQKAYDNFMRVSEIYGIVNSTYKQNIIDTSASFYAANAAVKLGKYEDATKIYNELINNKHFEDPEIYTNLADIALAGKDTSAAIAQLDKGITKYPTDQNLRIKQLNLYLFSHRFNEVIDKLKAAIDKEPTRGDLYQALGSAYENTKDSSNARKAYEKAIELNPSDFVANYSLGALIYNRAVEKIKAMNDLPASDQAGYDKLKKEGDALLQKSLPYLEKARALNGKDIETLNALKELYARLNMMDKLEEIKKAIAAISQ